MQENPESLQVGQEEVMPIQSLKLMDVKGLKKEHEKDVISL